jgi:hypothetical protein
LLAYLDTGEAIALLPRGLFGYFYTDPMTGLEARVTDSVAKRVREEALLLYKPLPAKSLTVRDLLAVIFWIV